ncbi:MAG: SPOR domain-containing protein [Rhodothermales bacterium]|nr:SPOR domain-containing protein [Rhodothermales bacterium]
MTSFGSDFAQRVGIETDSVDEVLEVLAEYVWGQVQHEGRCDIPGLGSFFVVDGKRIFEPSSELSRVVNYKYAGLSALAVDGSKSEILIPDTFSDVDAETESSFAPKWEELPEGDDEEAPVVQETPDFTEESLVAETTTPPVQADSESLISSFLGLDPPASSTDEDIDEFEFATTEQEIDTEPLPAEVEKAEAEAEVDRAQEAEAVPDSTGPLPVVIPIDENADPVVAKGIPQRSAWWYALPVLALVFIVLAVIWAQTRSTTPRPVRPAIVEQDDPNQDGETDSEATTETGDPVSPVPADPANDWSRGEINLADGGWTIIVSSEPTEAQAISVARELARDLDDTPLPVDILETRVNGQTRYRVAVGQYRTSAVAQRDLNYLGTRLPSGSWMLRLTDNT